MLLHHQAVSCEIDSDVVVGSTLIDMYGKCGLLNEARALFDILLHRNVVSYGAIIAGYAQHECGFCALELFEHMQSKGIEPNRVIFLGILAACSSEQILREGRWIHDSIVRKGMELDLSVGNTLVDMYSKCGSVVEAHKVFDILPARNVVSWGALITGHVQQEQNLAVLELFQKMQQENILPNRVIFLGILQACTNMGIIEYGELIHDRIIECGLESDVVVKIAIMKMYATVGNFQKALKLFDECSNQNIVAWSVMLAGYAWHEQDAAALKFYERMQEAEVKPDKFVLTCMAKVCGIAQASVEAKLLHDQVVRSGLERDVAVGSSLVDAYAKCGGVMEARRVFDNLPEKNEVTWGAMLAGYNQHEAGMLGLQLFAEMLQDGESPDRVRLVCILKACGNIGALQQGKMVHELIRKYRVQLGLILGNALIDMYAKCGELEEALRVLSELELRDEASWGAMIAGCAQHGLLELICLLLRAMQCEGIQPNDKIFSSVLSACSHAGLAEEGYRQFKAMIVDYSISPSAEHMNCMIDLLSRIGRLGEAERFLQIASLPPDSLTWTSLLTACRTYGNIKLGKNCYAQFVRLNPSVSSGYVMMSNIFADLHMPDKSNQVHESRKSVAAWKKPGKAWIEVSNCVHEFIVDDKTHPQVTNVLENLKRLRGPLKNGGFVPNLHPSGSL